MFARNLDTDLNRHLCRSYCGAHTRAVLRMPDRTQGREAQTEHLKQTPTCEDTMCLPAAVCPDILQHQANPRRDRPVWSMVCDHVLIRATSFGAQVYNSTNYPQTVSAGASKRYYIGCACQLDLTLALAPDDRRHQSSTRIAAHSGSFTAHYLAQPHSRVLRSCGLSLRPPLSLGS